MHCFPVFKELGMLAVFLCCSLAVSSAGQGVLACGCLHSQYGTCVLGNQVLVVYSTGSYPLS